MPIYKISKYLAIEPELHRKRGPAIAFSLVAAAVIFVLVGMIGFPNNVDADGIVEPAQKLVLNVRTPGFVKTIAAKDGQWLKEGDVILQCDDDQLDAQIDMQKSKVLEADAKIQQSYVTDPSQRRIDIETKKALEGQLNDLLARRDEQTIKAPFDGFLIAPKLSDSFGKWMQRGEEVGTVAQMHELVVYAALDQKDAQRAIIEPTASAEIKLAGNLAGDSLHVTEHRVYDEATTHLRHMSQTQQGGGDFALDPTDRSGTKLKQSAFEVFASFANPDAVIIRPAEPIFI